MRRFTCLILKVPQKVPKILNQPAWIRPIHCCHAQDVTSQFLAEVLDHGWVSSMAGLPGTSALHSHLRRMREFEDNADLSKVLGSALMLSNRCTRWGVFFQIFKPWGARKAAPWTQMTADAQLWMSCRFSSFFFTTSTSPLVKNQWFQEWFKQVSVRVPEVGRWLLRTSALSDKDVFHLSPSGGSCTSQEPKKWREKKTADQLIRPDLYGDFRTQSPTMFGGPVTKSSDNIAS